METKTTIEVLAMFADHDHENHNSWITIVPLLYIAPFFYSNHPDDQEKLCIMLVPQMVTSNLVTKINPQGKLRPPGQVVTARCCMQGIVRYGVFDKCERNIKKGTGQGKIIRNNGKERESWRRRWREEDAGYLEGAAQLKKTKRYCCSVTQRWAGVLSFSSHSHT